MDLALQALDAFLHLDRHLNTLGGNLGGWLYGLLLEVLVISVISVMPLGIEYLRARREARRGGPAAAGHQAG